MSEDKPTLTQMLGADPTRQKLIADCVGLVDEEVRAKSGLSGVAIKGAYGTVKRIKPRFVTEVVDGLLDDWLGKMEPYYERWQSAGDGTFPDYMTARSEDVAEDLLSVTDERATTTKHRTAKKAYEKMRPSAKRNVMAAIPKLGRVVDRHIQDARDEGAA